MFHSGCHFPGVRSEHGRRFAEPGYLDSPQPLRPSWSVCKIRSLSHESPGCSGARSKVFHVAPFFYRTGAFVSAVLSRSLVIASQLLFCRQELCGGQVALSTGNAGVKVSPLSEPQRAAHRDARRCPRRKPLDIVGQTAGLGNLRIRTAPGAESCRAFSCADRPFPTFEVSNAASVSPAGEACDCKRRWSPRKQCTS